MAVEPTQQGWIAPYRVWLSEAESLHNAMLVAQFFLPRSWSTNAIAAMCGNMRVESSVNPDMYEYGYDWEDDRGYGLVQWTPRSKYWNWAVSQGLPPREGDSQLMRIVYEQENGLQWIATQDYPITFTQFTQSTEDVEWLTEAFTWNYERPNEQAGWESMPQRKAFASLVYEEIEDFDPSPPRPDIDPYFIMMGARRHRRRNFIRR